MADKIGVVGYECEDIVLYLAYSLRELGKCVAIEDRTEHGIMFRMLDTEVDLRSGEETTIYFQEIAVTNSILHKEDYDVVFMVFGYRLLHPKLYECGKLILVTDDFPAHASLLKELEEWERRQILLVRNHIESKHGVSYLTHLTGQNTEEVLCTAWEEKDIRIRNSLGSAEYIRLHRLSPGMRENINRLVGFIVSDHQEGVCSKDRERGKTWEKWSPFGRR